MQCGALQRGLKKGEEQVLRFPPLFWHHVKPPIRAMFYFMVSTQVPFHSCGERILGRVCLRTNRFSREDLSPSFFGFPFRFAALALLSNNDYNTREEQCIYSVIKRCEERNQKNGKGTAILEGEFNIINFVVFPDWIDNLVPLVVVSPVHDDCSSGITWEEEATFSNRESGSSGGRCLFLKFCWLDTTKLPIQDPSKRRKGSLCSGYK